jgi:hypothetical protein
VLTAAIAFSSYMVFISILGAAGWAHQARKTPQERHIDYLRDSGDNQELFFYLERNYGRPTIVEHQPSGQQFFLN